MSTAESDIATEGFLAASREEEVRCQSEQISVLVETEEITEQILVATEGLEDHQANEARKQTLTRLEQSCEEGAAASETGKLSCETVSLYHGGQYFLYKYKRYDDVRLVFAPESAVAAFGGDPDNFNFPRYCLDMVFLRAYEDGKPASTPNYLKWRSAGAEAAEAVFVPGHPGATDRLLTVAEFKMLRDVTLPHWLPRYSELRGRLIQFAKSGDEARRIAQGPILSIENGIKVRRNEFKALLDDELFSRKRQDEDLLRTALAANPELQAKYGSSWEEIEQALANYLSFRDEHLFLELGVAFRSNLFTYARTLVRAAVEREKPNHERLRAYTEAALPGLRQRTLAARPVYPELEEVEFSFSLAKLREFLGPDAPAVKLVLATESPESLAHTLVTGSQLGDPAVREALWEGGLEAIEASEDTMIQLALKVDPLSRKLRKRYEDEVEAPVDAASEKIARARFALQGTSRYPDATFTFRLSYGGVKGWIEKGSAVEPFTYSRTAWDRTTGQDPFRMPQSWIEKRSQLDPETRFNFVATTDVTGGNSGSPVVDKDGMLVGLAFDGNIHSIAGSFWFDESKNRTVAVHPAIMLEVLKVVYEADHLLEELDPR
jgi:hypothetical protein